VYEEIVSGFVVEGSWSDLLLYPLIAQLALTGFLYAWLTVARFQAVRRKLHAYDDLAAGGGDVGIGARIAANLRNQFELPVLFAVIVLVMWLQRDATPIDLCLAWLFVAGRIIHTLVQTLTTNVVLRGLVFSINAIALAAMWTAFLLRALN